MSQLRAPGKNREVLSFPSLKEVPHLLEGNRAIFQNSSISLLGYSLTDLQNQARLEILQLANEYFEIGGEPLPSGRQNPTRIFIAGHQPELFHPGVWIKNFVLHHLARTHGGTALNLIVDNDFVKSTALATPQIKLPLPDIEQYFPALTEVYYDHGSMEEPYEERAVQDEDFFQSFPNRIPSNWGYEPLLGDFWNEVILKKQRTNLLGERFVGARREIERKWGCHNLEIPISHLCQSRAFALFACHILSNLESFQEIHNKAVQAYRKRNGLRSKHHPFPDLMREADWRETPFWAWKQGEKHRGRLFSRIQGGKLELRAGEKLWPDLPAPKAENPEKSISALQDLQRQGYKIRSRALSNTLFARLLIGDLFVHGIGGGKYDEVTDDIFKNFYLIAAPRYLITTATMHLPMPQYSCSSEEENNLHHQLRDLHFNPQRHLEGNGIHSQAIELSAMKQELIREQPTSRRERRRRFRDIRLVSEQLRDFIRDKESRLQSAWKRCQDEVKANEVLTRRDYSFCLYPENLLREFYSPLLEGLVRY